MKTTWPVVPVKTGVAHDDGAPRTARNGRAMSVGFCSVPGDSVSKLRRKAGFTG